MTGNGEVSGRTRIVLTPGQLVAVIGFVLALALYLAEIRSQITGVNGKLTVLAEDLSRLNRRVNRIDGRLD